MLRPLLALCCRGSRRRHRLCPFFRHLFRLSVRGGAAGFCRKSFQKRQLLQPWLYPVLAGIFCPVRLRRNRQPAVFHHAVFLCRAGLLFLFKAGRSKALPPAQKTGGGPGSSFAGSTGHRAGFSSGMCQRCLSAGQFFLCFTTDQGRHPGKIYDRFHPCLFGNPAERPAHRSPAASVAATAFPAAVFGCRLFSGFLSATALRLWDYPSHAAVPYRFVGAWGLSGAVSEQTD